MISWSFNEWAICIRRFCYVQLALFWVSLRPCLIQNTERQSMHDCLALFCRMVIINLTHATSKTWCLWINMRLRLNGAQRANHQQVKVDFCCSNKNQLSPVDDMPSELQLPISFLGNYYQLLIWRQLHQQLHCWIMIFMYKCHNVITSIKTGVFEIYSPIAFTLNNSNYPTSSAKGG